MKARAGSAADVCKGILRPLMAGSTPARPPIASPITGPASRFSKSTDLGNTAISSGMPSQAASLMG